MQKWLRRIRGAIGIGLIWGAVWSGVGTLPRWVFGVETDVPIPLVLGVLGFLAGLVFSSLLAVTEGRRGLDQLSLPRFAGWGAAGGLLLSVLFAAATSLGLRDVLALAPTLAIASAVSAAGSLVVAKRAERRELTESANETE